MGSMDDYPRKQCHHQQGRPWLMLKVLLLVVSTNLLTLYLFAGSSLDINLAEYAPRLHLWDTDALLRELNATQAKLIDSQAQLADIQRRLMTSNALLEGLLGEIRRVQVPPDVSDDGGWGDDLSGELKLAVGPHKLPLGNNPSFGSDELNPVLGSACRRHQKELEQYMSYDVGGECPVDDVFAQRLMLKGCEPLPRRRCHPKAPKGYVDPTPAAGLPLGDPPGHQHHLGPLHLQELRLPGPTQAHAGLLRLQGLLRPRRPGEGPLDVRQRPARLRHREGHRPQAPGTIRIGLDLGGGSGTFAARMREHNVTIVTTSMNFDGPFNSFIASRGLIPLHITISHRLPFFENTLDIIHSMHVISNWIPDVTLEFALYDIYRVLRPGGLFWLDHFFCLGSQLNATYAPMLHRAGFRKVRWHTGRKMDRGPQSDEWYLSALLEKPME